MEIECPQCHTDVDNQNLNIQTDLAKCQNCNHIFKISANLDFHEPMDGFDMNNPPKGTWIRKDINQFVIGASTRSPIAFFLVPFMIVWSGGSLGGIYGSQIINGEFDLFMSLFGIPFLMGAVIFWSLALMAIWGKVEMSLDKNGGRIFTGIGSLGLTKKFRWEEVSSVREKLSYSNRSSKQSSSIVLEGAKRVSFGIGLKDERRYYLLRSLQQILKIVKSNRNFV